MSTAEERSIPWILWPFWALWRLVTFVLEATGRILCGAIGLILMIAGTVLALSIVGAPVGIPLAVVGFLLLARAIF